MKYNFLLLSMVLLGMSSFFMACSTKKNTVVHRSYHNLTSRYNGYYYALESIKEGVLKLENGHMDDYGRILPIYKLSDEKGSKAIYPEMDKAYKKASNVVSRHSIMIKGTEYVKWIDDNYLAIGISHYYKRDYFASAEVFDFIIKQFKKEEIRYDAMVWLIRSYNENAIVSQAQLLIDLVDNDKKFPKRIRADLDMAIADFYLKREDYPMTAKYLEKALQNVKKKKVRTRLTFILAQLYQKTGDDRKASAAYAEVLKLNPSYEMAFQTKISLARSVDANSKNKKEIKAQLIKMLKDSKNAEYFDQIYYALAEISMKEKDEQQAVKHLDKSVQTSVNNARQKALSYLMLGEIYFSRPDYKNAEAYYDSCASALPTDYFDYERIMGRREILSNLISNLTTIEKEDSLQRIALMNETDRDKFIERLIDDLVKEEYKRREEEEKRLEAIANNPGLVQNNTSGSETGNNPGGVWYFHNTTAMSFGFNEFRKKWGDRKLEDNWRRSMKEIQIYAENEDNEEESDTNATSIVDPIEAIKNKEQYLVNLPLTEEEMKKSNEKMIEAYYSAGAIYKEQLTDNNAAIKVLEEFLGRFPDTKQKLPSCYSLYRCNLAVENQVRADYYKNIILDQYSESEFARLIRNPDQTKATTAGINEIEEFYTETYNKYILGELDYVLQNCIKADTLYAKSKFSPKFDFLKAMVIGKTQGAGPLESSLKQIVVKYPNDEVKTRAEEILEYLENSRPQQADSISSKYLVNKDVFHNCILLVSKNLNIEELKIAVSDFNFTYFSTEELNISNLFFDENSQMLVIAGFPSQAKAMTYYNAIKGDANINSATGSNSSAFAISIENYPVLYKDKDIEEYDNFFKAKYLTKK